MIDNKLWIQTNKTNEELLDRTMEKYFASLEMFCKHVDWSDFDINDLEKSLKVINEMIVDVGSIKSEIGITSFKNKYYNQLKDNSLSFLDYYKIFICSHEVYHFWNMPFDGLLKFYFENKKKDNKITVDLFIGKMQYLFDLDNDTQFEKFEKFIILNSKI